MVFVSDDSKLLCQPIFYSLVPILFLPYPPYPTL